MFIPPDERNAKLDRWIDDGVGITRNGVLWTVGSFGLLALLVLANWLKG